MKKLILVGFVVISCAVARDCRYEEQELNNLMWKYEDLQLQREEILLAEKQAQEALNAQMRKDYDLATTSTKHSLVDFMDKEFEYGWKQNVDIPQATKQALERNALQEKQLNKRIKQAKQRLNNCRSKK